MIKIKSNREKAIMEMHSDKFMEELNLVMQQKSQLPKRLRDLVLQRAEWLIKQGHIRLYERPPKEILRPSNYKTPTPD